MSGDTWVTATGWTTAHLLSPHQRQRERWHTRCGRSETKPQRDGADRKRCTHCARQADATWSKPRVVPTEHRARRYQR